MDVIRLRTLTRKSILNFGKFLDQSVQMLLDEKKLKYLSWIYFHCDRITFIDEILDDVGITEKWRIEKPGKAPEKWDNYSKYRGKLFYQELKKEYINGAPVGPMALHIQHRKKLNRKSREQMQNSLRQMTENKYRTSAMNPTK